MRLGGVGTTGSRTLAAYGFCHTDKGQHDRVGCLGERHLSGIALAVAASKMAATSTTRTYTSGSGTETVPTGMTSVVITVDGGGGLAAGIMPDSILAVVVVAPVPSRP